MDFVCFSINNWEKRRARKQQFMLHLSKRGDVGCVLYVEPALNLWRLILLPWVELGSIENRKRWIRALSSRPQKLGEKLFLYTPIFSIPFSFRFQAIYNLDLFFSYLWIRLLLKRMNFKNIVLWLYHPFDYCLLRWFKKRYLACFDWAEKWTEYFIEYANNPKKQKMVDILEHRVIANVDIVFVVSQRLLKEAEKFSKNVFLLRDGTIFDIFKNYDKEIPNDLKNIKHPIVGYAGALSDRIDMRLLEELISQCSGCSFVFVGDIHYNRIDISFLEKSKNVYLLGGKPYSELPKYLMNFDVCIIPYVSVEYTPAPTKIFDYLATGKPIVSVYLPDLEIYNDVMRLAKNRDEFVEFVKQGLDEKNDEMAKMRILRAEQNSWDARSQEIVDILERGKNA